MPSSPQPKNVDVSLTEGVTIVWDDGRENHYSILQLRAACPCATCADLHHTGDRSTAVPAPAAPGAALLPIYKPTGATLRGVQPVGRYALQFDFSDGHKTGIFTWEYLRELGEKSEP
ncbi:MAG: gamma-butyrobetaine hydroxylase-like domain-containing protein [Terriglobales bacterium]